MPVDLVITIVFGLTFENWPRTPTGNDCPQQGPRSLQHWPRLDCIPSFTWSALGMQLSLHSACFLKTSWVSWPSVENLELSVLGMLGTESFWNDESDIGGIFHVGCPPCQSGCRDVLAWSLMGKKKKEKKMEKVVPQYYIFSGILCFAKHRLKRLLLGGIMTWVLTTQLHMKKKQNTHKQGFKQIIISVAAGQGKHLTSEDESNHKSQCNSPVSASVENQYI